MDRRTFLAAAASASLASLSTKANQVTSARVPVVDAHVHCFAGSESDSFPYHPRGPYRPSKAAPPERLLELMEGAGVDFAVIVHPEPYHDDHRYLEHCLKVGNGKFRGVCHFFAEQEDSCARMTDLVRRIPDGIVAVRVHAYAPERLAPLGSPQLRELWRCASELGIAVQIHFEPRYAPPFEPLIREFKDTTVIVDHLGRPFQGTRAEHQVVLEWAKYPNVVMKLSGIPAKEQYPHRDAAPAIAELAERFGPDRLVYGGGFSADATAASYRAAREQIAACLPSLSPGEMEKVFGGNAERLFHIQSESSEG